MDTQTTNDKLGLGLKDGEAARVTTGKSMGVLSVASQQWHTRPDDERYLSLDALSVFLKGRFERSREQNVIIEHLAVRVDGNGKDLVLFDE